MLSEWVQGWELSQVGENKAGLLEGTWSIEIHGTHWAIKRTSYHLCKATFYPHRMVVEIKGDSQQLKKGKCCNNLQMLPQGQKVRVSLALGKTMEWVLLEGTSEDLGEEKVTWNSQHGLTNNKSCLSNLVVLFDKITGLVDEGNVVICF